MRSPFSLRISGISSRCVFVQIVRKSYAFLTSPPLRPLRAPRSSCVSLSPPAQKIPLFPGSFPPESLPEPLGRASSSAARPICGDPAGAASAVSAPRHFSLAALRDAAYPKIRRQANLFALAGEDCQGGGRPPSLTLTTTLFGLSYQKI